MTTQLAAYYSTGGCNGTLSEIACNEDVSNSNYLSTMLVPGATLGDTVWVQVDGWGPNGGLTGDFEIQVTLLPALPYDASIENTSIVATGLAGYTLVPPSQNNPPIIKINVNNIGQNSVSNANVSGIINPGNSNISASASTISPFSTVNLSSSSITSINPSTTYTANLNLTITESDGDLSNNNETFSFTSGVLGDTVFALENASSPTAGHGGVVPTRLGNRFEFTSPDTVTSITIYLVNPSISNFALSVHGFDPVSNTMLSNLWTTGIIPTPGPGFHTFTTNLALVPGSYLISVLQPGNASITLGMTNQVHRNNTSFFGTPNGQSLFTLEELNISNTYMIRANLNTQQNQVISLYPFGLLSPLSGTRLSTINPNLAASVNISWNSSGNSLALPMSYKWLLDFQGGDFSNPIADIQSNSNGADSSLTLTYGAIDSIIASLGIAQGDSISLSWTVRASTGNNSRVASNGPFDLKFVRELVSGLNSTNMQSRIHIYPNPGKGIFNIDFKSGMNEEYSIEIIDLYNIVQYRKILNSEKDNTVNISDLPSGVYLYTIRKDKEVIKGKIIKD